MAGERTEAASPRRLQEMRSKGQVIHSTDLTAATGLLVSLFLLRNMGGEAVIQMQQYLEQTLTSVGPGDFSETTVAGMGMAAGNVVMAALTPIFVVLPIAAISITMMQTGPVLSGHGLTPDFERLNPIAALKRLFSARSMVEMVKSLVKVGILTFLVSRMYLESTGSFLSLGGNEVRNSVAMLLELIMRLGMTAAVALFALAALDYGYQRWEFQRSAMMSKDDLKDEHRQSEGSPQVRQRIRALQRQLARGRMLQDVPTADVIITNPTHLAIALSYHGEDMAAPKVVAKGADHIAARIREIGQKHNVPLVENKPLAQALYRSVEVGNDIPAALFQAVAEVLAYIYRLRSRGLGGV
ncbi:MAG: flagellar biosynthesis protein FlhB [Chloroflexota bacterium]